MLVPEIALTPAVAAVFREVFGDRVAVQHSGLSDGERHDQWYRIRNGAIDIVVGTRSAIFSPLDEIGLIIVDEEHDPSYKQEETPRYNGRDLAIVRARQAHALVVLGSATPSMESYRHALEGRYELISLERRVLDRPLADGARRQHARGACRGRSGRHPERDAPSRAPAAPRTWRAGVAAAQPERLLHVGVLPPVRRHARLPELQHLAHGAPPPAGGAAGALPLLQSLDGRAEGVSRTARDPTWSTWDTGPSRSRRKCSACCRRHAWRGSTGTPCSAAARSRECSRDSHAASST